MTTKRRRLGNARHLHANMTDAEECLWERLRHRQILGAKFRRQHPFRDYIAGFACTEARLIIEVNDARPDTAERDALRDASFHDAGFRVLRFEGSDVLQETRTVLEAIQAAVAVSSDSNAIPIMTP